MELVFLSTEKNNDTYKVHHLITIEIVTTWQWKYWIVIHRSLFQFYTLYKFKGSTFHNSRLCGVAWHDVAVSFAVIITQSITTIIISEYQDSHYILIFESIFLWAHKLWTRSQNKTSHLLKFFIEHFSWDQNSFTIFEF